MAFSAISSDWLDIGDPNKKELWDLVKSNLDDLDDRLSDVEAATTSESPIQFQVDGEYYRGVSSITGASPIIRVPFNITLTSGRLQIIDDGSSGTLTTDVKYKRGAGAWTTIFSSIPSLAQGGGDYGTDTGTLSVTDIDAGDILRLDITSVMVGNDQFNVYLEWEIRT